MRTATIATIIVAAVILLLCGYAWLILSWDVVEIAFWPSGRRFAVPAALLPLIGLAAAGAVGLARLELIRWDMPRYDESRDWARPQPARWTADIPDRLRLTNRISLTLLIAIWALAVLLLVAVERGAAPLHAALLLVCGGGTLLATAYALAGLIRGQTVEMSSHWGGLGGGIGGWRVSSVTVTVLLALVFLGATIAVSGRDHATSNNQTEANDSGNGTEADNVVAETNAAATNAANESAPAANDAAANQAAANGAQGPG